MITIDDMRAYITRAVAEGTDDPTRYDIDDIVAEIHQRWGLVNIDTLTHDDFWGIVWLADTGSFNTAQSIATMGTPSQRDPIIDAYRDGVTYLYGTYMPRNGRPN